MSFPIFRSPSQISIIKPNLSEFCAIVEESLKVSKITNCYEIEEILKRMMDKKSFFESLSRLGAVESSGSLDIKESALGSASRMTETVEVEVEVEEKEVGLRELKDVVKLAECLLTMMRSSGDDGDDDDDDGAVSSSSSSSSDGGVEVDDDFYIIRGTDTNNEGGRKSCQSTTSTNSLGKHVIVTLGSSGAIWCGVSGEDAAKWMHFPAISLGDVGRGHNTNGAGDAFCAGVVHHMLVKREVRNQNNRLSGSGMGTGVSVAGLTLTKESIQSGLFQAHSKIIRSVR